MKVGLPAKSGVSGSLVLVIPLTELETVESASVAIQQNREDIIELHILVFNALMRMAVEEKDVRKFQNLSYHYRLLVERLDRHSALQG